MGPLRPGGCISPPGAAVTSYPEVGSLKTTEPIPSSVLEARCPKSRVPLEALGERVGSCLLVASGGLQAPPQCSSAFCGHVTAVSASVFAPPFSPFGSASSPLLIRPSHQI